MSAPVDTAELRREADEWEKVEDAMCGLQIAKPTTTELLRAAADEIDRLRARRGASDAIEPDENEPTRLQLNADGTWNVLP